MADKRTRLILQRGARQLSSLCWSIMRPLIGLLANDASLLGHHGSALVTSQARRLAETAGISLETGYDWDTVERMLSGANAFDLVIVNGEGSIHHNSKTAKRIARLARDLSERNIPAYLINASEEENGAEVYTGLATFRSVHTRDQASQRSLGKAGIFSRVVHDLTLTWDAVPQARGDGPILVTDAAEEAQTKRLFGYAQRTGLQSVTLRTAPPWPKQGLSRRRIAFEGKRLLGMALPASAWNLRYSGAIRDFDVFISLLSNSRGIISGRFHAVCLALRLRLPFLSVAAPTSKIDNLLSEIGLVDRILDPKELDRAARPVDIAPFSNADLDKIATFLPLVERAANEMFNEIASHSRSSLGRNY